MSCKIKKHSSFLLAVIILLLVSCRSYDLAAYTPEIISYFCNEALAAEVKYSKEPEYGTSNPFPASFVITGKVLVLMKAEGCSIPEKEYKDNTFFRYGWFSEDPDEIRYIVLTDIDEDRRLVYTIVDLGYDEQVYKGITETYGELAEILEGLTLR